MRRKQSHGPANLNGAEETGLAFRSGLRVSQPRWCNRTVTERSAVGSRTGEGRRSAQSRPVQPDSKLKGQTFRGLRIGVPLGFFKFPLLSLSIDGFCLAGPTPHG